MRDRRHTVAKYERHRAKIAKRRGFTIPLAERCEGAPVADRLHVARANLRYGNDLEHRAVEAFTEGDLPPWFQGLRPAREEEDAAGIDLWAITPDGEVPVQVKSSAWRARLFREQRPWLECAVVVLHMEMSFEVIRERVLSAVGLLWVKRMSRRAA